MGSTTGGTVRTPSSPPALPSPSPRPPAPPSLDRRASSPSGTWASSTTPVPLSVWPGWWTARRGAAPTPPWLGSMWRGVRASVLTPVRGQSQTLPPPLLPPLLLPLLLPLRLLPPLLLRLVLLHPLLAPPAQPPLHPQ